MSFMDGPLLPNLLIGIFGLKFFCLLNLDKPSTWPKTETCCYDIQPNYPAFKLHINLSCFEMTSFMDGPLPNLPIGIFGLKYFFLNFAALISHQLDQRQKLEQRLEAGNSELQTLTRNAHGLKVLLEARTKFIQTGVADVSNKFAVVKSHPYMFSGQVWRAKNCNLSTDLKCFRGYL